ncbi:hypothetical protein [Dysgonomonas sp.]
MAQTYTVRVYDMTPKYATYTPLTTPTVRLSEPKTQSYADALEEELRIKRLQAELRELERGQTSNTNNANNTKLTKVPEMIKGYQYKESKWLPIMLKVVKDGSNIILVGFKDQNQEWIDIYPVTTRTFTDNKLYSNYIDFEDGRVCFKY